MALCLVRLPPDWVTLLPDVVLAVRVGDVDGQSLIGIITLVDDMEVGVIAVTLLERPRLVIRMSQRGVAEADMVGHDLDFTLLRLFVTV